MKTIHFNTGRLYTEHGQRITATLHNDKRVTFYDHDRHVYGEITPIPNIPRSKFNASFVMEKYDSMSYTNSTLAYKDGMQLSGVNSKYREK